MKRVKKYVSAGPVTRLISWVLALAALALLGFGIYRTTIKDDPNDATRFDSISEKNGDYVFLDVVAVSDWVCEYTDGDGHVTLYYAAIANDGYLYALALSDTQYSAMAAQQDAWDEFIENDDLDTEGESYRIYGTARTLPSEAEDIFCDTFELTSGEFADIFGEKILNGKSQPSDTRGIGWIVGGAIIGILWYSFSINGGAKRRKSLKSSVERLRRMGKLEEAVAEFDSPEVMVGNDNCRISKNYYYAGRHGAIIPIGDILWCYRHVTKSNGKAGDVSLLANTCTGKTYILATLADGDVNGVIDEIIAALLKRNPTILVGHNEQNRTEYRNRFKTFRNTGTRPIDNLSAIDTNTASAPVFTAAPAFSAGAAASAAAAAVAAASAFTAAKTAEEATVQPAAASEATTEAPAAVAAVAEESTETAATTETVAEEISEVPAAVEVTEAVASAEDAVETAAPVEAVAEEISEIPAAVEAVTEETAEAAAPAEAVAEEVNETLTATETIEEAVNAINDASAE